MALISWVCGLCKHYNSSSMDPFDPEKCSACGTLRSERHASMPESTRTTYLYNPRTRDMRTPGRADRPVHPKYAAEGYEKRYLEHVPDIRKFEKKYGLVHEATNYDSGSGTAERDTGARTGFDRT